MLIKLAAPRRAFARLAHVPLIILIIHLAVAAQTLLVASNAEHQVSLIHPVTFERQKCQPNRTRDRSDGSDLI